jgi:chromosome segregation ATPase
MAIDTLELAKTLAGPDGFTQRQAELLARTLHQVEETRLAGVETHLKAVEGRLDKIEFRVEAVEGRLDRIESKVEAIEGRLDRIESKVEAIEGRLDRIESKTATHTAILALVVMLLGGGVWQLVTTNRALGQLEASVAALARR